MRVISGVAHFLLLEYKTKSKATTDLPFEILYLIAEPIFEPLCRNQRNRFTFFNYKIFLLNISDIMFKKQKVLKQ